MTKVSLRVRKILLHETERHQNKIRDTSVSQKYLSMRRRGTFLRRRGTFVKRRDIKVKISGFLTKQKDVFTLKIKRLAKNEKAESFRIKGVNHFFPFKSFNDWDKQIKSL